MKEYYDDTDIKDNFKFTQHEYNKTSLIDFVNNSKNEYSHHFAIECESEYAGTISLKNLDYINFSAEYAIVVRRKYWGKGVSKEATLKIIEYAFEILNLNKVYLSVLSSNERANNFYRKMGFKLEGTFHNHIKIKSKYHDINWYAIFKKRKPTI